MSTEHAVVAFSVFHLTHGFATLFMQQVNMSSPVDLSAAEARLRQSGISVAAHAIVLGGFVLGIVLLFDVAAGTGWLAAILLYFGLMIVALQVSAALRRRMPSGLGITVPGLLGLCLCPFTALWAWVACTGQ